MEGRHVNRALALSLAGIVGVIALTPAPAAAVEPETHCWMDLDSGETGCYSSFALVVDALSEGTVEVAADAITVTDAQRAAITPLSTFIIGQVFADASYAGSSYTFYTSGDCDTNADVDWNVASMPTGWNDRVTSFKSFGQCATRIWQDTSYGGASYGFYVNSTNVGATMNDETSSIQWN